MKLLPMFAHDFNSGRADLLGVTPNGKIIGVTFTKVRVPLPAPIAYAPAALAGKLALRWKRAPDKASGRELVQLWIATPSNSTGTEGLSENVLSFMGSGCASTASTRMAGCATPCSA